MHSPGHNHNPLDSNNIRLLFSRTSFTFWTLAKCLDYNNIHIDIQCVPKDCHKPSLRLVS